MPPRKAAPKAAKPRVRISDSKPCGCLTPCGGCKDKETQCRTKTARYVFIRQLFRVPIMNELIQFAESQGFGQATFVDGSPRDDVSVFFLQRDECPENLIPIFDKIVELSYSLNEFFSIAVYPDLIQSIQVARYLPGNEYGWHVDHDTSLKSLEYDRKISLYVSCTNNGQFAIEDEPLNASAGDAIAFPSNMTHAAPKQLEGVRYSFVAWIVGPPWK